MELLNLHYFMTVAKYHNFTKAARAVYTSQSNISKQIAAIEEELGTPLFLRTKSGVEFTSAGEYLFDGLSTILPKLERLLEEVSNFQENMDRPALRLGICTTMDLNRIVPNFFAKLQGQADFSVELFTCHLTEIAEKLTVGSIDCAFVFNLVDLGIPDIRRIPLTRDNPRLYYSEKHPLYKKAGLTIEDFQEETFIRTMDKGGNLDEHEALPYEPIKVQREKSLNTAVQYISSGSAIGVFGPSQNMLDRSDIHTIELPTANKVGADAVWISANTSPALLRFIVFLETLGYRPE